MRSINIHATCIRLGRAGLPFGAPAAAGVLLIGKSGSGKSDLALRLIERGAELVADDRTDLFIEKNRLMARPPASIRGLLEVRGLGIITLPARDKVAVTLVARLGGKDERIPERKTWLPPRELGISPRSRPPLVILQAFEASAPARLAVAAAAFARRLFREDVKRQ